MIPNLPLESYINIYRGEELMQERYRGFLAHAAQVKRKALLEMRKTMSVQEIADALGVTRQAIYRQLKLGENEQ